MKVEKKHFLSYNDKSIRKTTISESKSASGSESSSAKKEDEPQANKKTVGLISA